MRVQQKDHLRPQQWCPFSLTENLAGSREGIESLDLSRVPAVSNWGLWTTNPARQVSRADEGEVGPGWVMRGRCGDGLELGGKQVSGGVTARLGEPVVVEALHEAAGALVTDRSEGDQHIAH